MEAQTIAMKLDLSETLSDISFTVMKNFDAE